MGKSLIMNRKYQYFSEWMNRYKWVNKYTITAVVFLVWLMFFDKYNMFAQYRLKKSTVELSQQYDQLKLDIEKATIEKEELIENREKYGREKYYLHKENEEVFIIEKK